MMTDLNCCAMKRTVSELTVEFMDEQDVNELSKRTYRMALAHYVRWVVVEGLAFWELRRKDVIAYKFALMKEGKSLYTVDLYLTVVRKFYGWLSNQGLYENIALGVRSPRKDHKFKKGYLTMEQVNRLLGAIDRTTVIGKRDYCMISMMVGTGVRRVEICRMTVGDVCNGAQVYVRLQRKGHSEKDCELGITDRILETIHDYLLCRSDIGDGMPLFVNHAKGYQGRALKPAMVSKIVKNRLRGIGIDDKRFTCHSLRHTAAILAIKAGADLYEVQQMLGHTDVKMTTIYLKALEEEVRINNGAVRSIDKMFSERLEDGKNGRNYDGKRYDVE